MKTAKSNPQAELVQALKALTDAILEDASDRYERLVASALQAGASEEQIDEVVHQAMRALFVRAEQPLTPRHLSQGWPSGHFRS